MKKLFCSIASLATAVLTFVFLSIPCIVSSAMGVTVNSSGWDLIKNEQTVLGVTAPDAFNEINGYTLTRIFLIVALVVACILAILGIILLLQQFGIIKSEMNFRFISAILLAVFTVVAIVAMIGVIVMVKDMGADIPSGIDNIGVSIGAGVILNVVVGVIATAISFLFARDKK